jgi:hypothetical protein
VALTTRFTAAATPHHRSNRGGVAVNLERWRTPFLACGLLAGVLYVTMTLVVGELWSGYSTAHQTISELSAIGAPTRPLWIVLGSLYNLLIGAFGWIVWKTAQPGALRVVGALLLTHAVFDVWWPPMHQRTVLAAGGSTLTDTLHIAWTIVTSVLFVAALGFGAAAFGKRFRLYSLATVAIAVGCGLWTGTYAQAIQADLPTPWVGVWERLNTSAFMVWVAVLAIILIHRAMPQARGSV